MSSSPFRPSVTDQLDVAERLDDRIRVVSGRAWGLIAIQCTLLVLVLAWGLFGRLPVNVRGEAVYLGSAGAEALVTLDGADPSAVPLGARALLETRDGARRRFTGSVVALAEPSALPESASAAGCECGQDREPQAHTQTPPQPRLAVALDVLPATAPSPAQGERLSVLVTLREEPPLARVLGAGWWR